MNSENECDCDCDLNIRKPDEIIKEKLIYDNIDEDEDELKLALSVSENEYYENNLLVELENELETVLQFSKNEYDNYLILEENKLMEIEQNIIIQKINNRIKSLENFSKKIEKLNYSEDDKLVKNYINNVLQKWYKLEIDYIYVENAMYKKIYDIIDNYYLNPFKKKFNKYAISKEEDEIVRSIFLGQF
jgi:hypothetical protein